MTVTDQIKIINRKIKQNESQYDLDRKAAEISALSSKNLDKYEYLTGEDLGLKPSTIEKAKFEYSPLGLSEEDKKEGLLKKLKNIEDKNEMQLKTIKDQGEKQMREIKDINRNNTLKVIDHIGRKSANTNKILRNIKKINNKLESAELVCIKTDGTKYDFNIFTLPLRFAEKIHNYEFTLDKAINNQTELSILINKLTIIQEFQKK